MQAQPSSHTFWLMAYSVNSVAGTIEERILKLQDKKQLVFEGTVGRDAEALTRLTEDDLRFLFSWSLSCAPVLNPWVVL